MTFSDDNTHGTIESACSHMLQFRYGARPVAASRAATADWPVLLPARTLSLHMRRERCHATHLTMKEATSSLGERALRRGAADEEAGNVGCM